MLSTFYLFRQKSGIFSSNISLMCQYVIFLIKKNIINSKIIENIIACIKVRHFKANNVLKKQTDFFCPHCLDLTFFFF
jgi:hypothetical protein